VIFGLLQTTEIADSRLSGATAAPDFIEMIQDGQYFIFNL
jgi:hypothetical protein